MIALDGGINGFDVACEILEFLQSGLDSSGCCLLELHHNHKNELSESLNLKKYGLQLVDWFPDWNDVERFCCVAKVV